MDSKTIDYIISLKFAHICHSQNNILHRYMIRNILRYLCNRIKNKAESYYIFNGKVEGEYKSWYRSGRLHEQCYYKNGKLHGIYQKWSDNYNGSGGLIIHAPYIRGKLHGEVREWYENGQLYVCQHFHNDRQVGNYTKWKPDGKIWIHRYISHSG